MKGLALLALLLLLGLPLTTAAGVENSICIQLKDLGTDWTRVSFEAYRVGEMVENRPVIDAVFSVGSFPEEAQKLDAAARKISGEISGNADRSGWTDEKGMLAFEGMEEGVYLVKPGNMEQYGEIAPFLVPLPCWDEAGTWLHRIEIEPKASLKEIQGEETDWNSEWHPAAEKPAAAATVVKTGDATAYLPYVGELLGAGFVCLILGWFLAMRKRGD